jgi:hypothetical protein
MLMACSKQVGGAHVVLDTWAEGITSSQYIHTFIHSTTPHYSLGVSALLQR